MLIFKSVWSTNAIPSARTFIFTSSFSRRMRAATWVQPGCSWHSEQQSSNPKFSFSPAHFSPVNTTVFKLLDTVATLYFLIIVNAILNLTFRLLQLNLKNLIKISQQTLAKAFRCADFSSTLFDWVLIKNKGSLSPTWHHSEQFHTHMPSKNLIKIILDVEMKIMHGTKKLCLLRNQVQVLF